MNVNIKLNAKFIFLLGLTLLPLAAWADLTDQLAESAPVPDHHPHARAASDASPLAAPDNRIRLLPYDPNTIYPILTRVGYETYIEFAAQEAVQTISLGERSSWQIIPADNRLFLRPLRPGAATNMTVITSRHAYQFDISSVDETPLDELPPVDEKEEKKTESKNTQRHLAEELEKVVYVARFTYPSDTPATPRPLPAPATPSAPPPPPPPSQAPPPRPVALQPPAPTPQPLLSPPATALPPESARNYLYTYSGPQADAPYEIFDDGSATYLRYATADHPEPAVFSLGEDGKETRLAAYSKDGYTAVNAVVPALVLRSGDSTVFVYNESLAPHP